MKDDITILPKETGASEQSPKVKRSRSRTLSRKRMARELKRMKNRGELLQVISNIQPKKRSDCYKMKRPCLFVTCRHHLYLDINEETGSVKCNYPDKEVWELNDTCALDIAENGGITLEEIGQVMNLTRERVRQIEIQALAKLREKEKGEDTIEEYADFDLENDAELD